MQVPVREGPLAPALDRVVAAVVVLAAVAVVALLASVPADPRGFGTHERLGMAPCSWPRDFGAPCPTCGVTTAATLLVQLRPLRAVATQPFGAALAAAGIWSAVVASCCLVRGRSFVAWLATRPVGTISVVALVLLLGSWGYCWLTWPAR